MVNSVSSVKLSHSSANVQNSKSNTENVEKEYGWMKEKNGNAFGFKAHNKHYLDYQAKIEAAKAAVEAAKAEAATAATTATTTETTDTTSAIATNTTLNVVA